MFNKNIKDKDDEETEEAPLEEEEEVEQPINYFPLLTDEEKFDMYLKKKADEIRMLTYKDVRLFLPRKIYQIQEDELYEQCCRQLGIVPVSEYLNDLRCEHLDLKQRRLGPQGAKALCRSLLLNGTITHLDLEGNDIGEGIKYLDAMLMENSIITHVNLANNKIGSQGSMYVYNILTNPNIEAVNLSGSDFQDSQGKRIGMAIEETKSLVDLDLSHNSFSDFAGKMIGKAIAGNSTLERLDLSWNKFLRIGAIGLFNGLKANSSLKIVNLSWNGFDDEVSDNVAAALKGNSSLKYLDIGNNNFTNEGALGISKGLKSNDALDHLRLTGNPFSAVGALEILKAINRPSNSMAVLDLKDIRVNREFMKTLKMMKESRKINVIFGRVVRKSIFPKLYLSAKVLDIKQEHPIETIEKIVEEQGINLRKILEERMLFKPPEEPPSAEVPPPAPEVPPLPPEVPPLVPEVPPPAPEVEEKDFCLTKEDFILFFVSPPLSIDQHLVEKLIPYVADPDEKINLSKVIAEMPSRQDDIEDEPPPVPEPPVEDKGKGKGKK